MLVIYGCVTHSPHLSWLCGRVKQVGQEWGLAERGLLARAPSVCKQHWLGSVGPSVSHSLSDRWCLHLPAAYWLKPLPQAPCQAASPWQLTASVGSIRMSAWGARDRPPLPPPLIVELAAHHFCCILCTKSHWASPCPRCGIT